jgi:hypothetical protein
MNFIEFLIGGLIANGLVHFIVGITKVKFLGMFGYSPKGNVAYGLLQFVGAIGLILCHYSFQELLSNGLLIGALSVFVAFLIFGPFLVRFYSKK